MKHKMPSETDSDGILALTPVRAGKAYRLIFSVRQKQKGRCG
ncbi:hypothetical protein NMH_2322 [Neisseria meningitidis H44/76]|uniref:Uncharacterized protein n=1 Tax=Neisseria meningitidis serogroup B / serotype 15 (strain H44/76) TaxID=909420 RepID=E6N0K6_NEIMH|nr:hypothetical protein NMH_2322 [Neisseria meningitidis H44/76]